MRTPRTGARWTPQRLARRVAYADYMTSAAWLRRRAWWFREHRRRTGTDPACAVCGALDGLELHHHEYTRLGARGPPLSAAGGSDIS